MSAYLDAELNSQATKEIADHLVACPSCREQFEELEGVDRLLQELPVHGMPREFAGEVIMALGELECTRQTGSIAGRAWNWFLQRALVFVRLLQGDAAPATGTLEEFGDMPSSFIGYAYFKILG